MRFIQSFGTAAGTARIDTDGGEGYIKALGNAEGPHILACELVGSLLADWLGLPTLDFALIDVTADDEIPFYGGGIASPGPAFISRAEQGTTWGGTADELKAAHNQHDISGLVVLDTWVRNCDRYAPEGIRVNRDNVFFVQYPGSKKEVLLKAIDFTHAFACGRALNRQLGFIDNVRDERIYGLFPEFTGFLNREEVRRLATRLSEFGRPLAVEFTARLPNAWEVDNQTKSIWATMIAERAQFVSETIESRLWPQQEFY
jgi:hypothetical protein